MPTENPWGQQAHTYHAQEDRRMLSRLGVRAGVPASADLAVTTASSGLQVTVAAGDALIQGSHAGVTRQGLYPVRLPANENIAMATAHATLPRIDKVVLRIRDTEAQPGVAGDASSAGTIETVTGTATAGASLTNLVGLGATPASSLLLAYVLVPAGFAGPFVNATHILDMRVGVHPNETATTLRADPRGGHLLARDRVDTTATGNVSAGAHDSEIARDLTTGTTWRVTYSPTVDCLFDIQWMFPQVADPTDAWQYVSIEIQLDAGSTAILAGATTHAVAAGAVVIKDIHGSYGPGAVQYMTINPRIVGLPLVAGGTYIFKPKLAYTINTPRFDVMAGTWPYVAWSAWSR